MASGYSNNNGTTPNKGPDWSIVSPIGPSVAYHASCVLNNKIYIHGGINRKGSTVPLNKMWCMDLDASIWNEIHASNSPALSHHTCVTLADRYLLLIGEPLSCSRCYCNRETEKNAAHFNLSIFKKKLC